VVLFPVCEVSIGENVRLFTEMRPDPYALLDDLRIRPSFESLSIAGEAIPARQLELTEEPAAFLPAIIVRDREHYERPMGILAISGSRPFGRNDMPNRTVAL
jgi:hypothetical protein